MPDWTDAPYVRVYLTLADDYPAVWRDPTLLGWWLRCLVAADRWYPAPAPLPFRMPDEAREALAAAGIVEVIDDEFYRFHGLESQRRDNASRGRKGGQIRAATARRAHAGRFAGGATLADAGNSSVNRHDDAGGYAGGNAGDKALVTSEKTGAGHQRTSEENRREETLTSQPLGLVSVGSTKSTYRARDDDDDQDLLYRGTPPEDDPAVNPMAPLTPSLRASMVRSHGPDDAECDELELHALHHRWYAGVGWRCVLCERSDVRSFDDRILEAGGEPRF